MAKNLPALEEIRVQSLVRKIPWRREWLSTPVFLPGESLGQRNLGGYSPGGCKESDTTEQLTLSLGVLKSHMLPSVSKKNVTAFAPLLQTCPSEYI